MTDKVRLNLHLVAACSPDELRPRPPAHVAGVREGWEIGTVRAQGDRMAWRAWHAEDFRGLAPCSGRVEQCGAVNSLRSSTSRVPMCPALPLGRAGEFTGQSQISGGFLFSSSFNLSNSELCPATGASVGVTEAAGAGAASSGGNLFVAGATNSSPKDGVGAVACAGVLLTVCASKDAGAAVGVGATLPSLANQTSVMSCDVPSEEV